MTVRRSLLRTKYDALIKYGMEFCPGSYVLQLMGWNYVRVELCQGEVLSGGSYARGELCPGIRFGISLMPLKVGIKLGIIKL